MNNSKNSLIGLYSCILDGVIIFGSYLISTYIRFDVMYGNQPALVLAWNTKYVLAAILYTVIILLVLYLNRLYTTSFYKSIWKKLLRIVIVNTFGIACVTSIFYFTKVVDFTRIGLILFLIISTLLLIIKYSIMRLISHNYYEHGFIPRHVLVVGNGNLARKYIATVSDDKGYGVIPAGYVSKTTKPELGKCLGTYEDLDDILTDPEISEVVVALESHETKFMPFVIQACEKAGTKISIIPFYNDFMPMHPSIELVGNVKLMNLRTIPLDDLGSAAVKRFFDVFLGILIIILTSPIMLVAAIGIKITMPGPILFTQDRIGKDKKLFKMYKFRSMKINNQSNVAWSTGTDDRRTPFGRFIRKFSIDELPQLFNVVKGDMSLIGPRPEIPFYVNKFKEDVPLYLVRQQVRPGMTGLAQINGLRGDTSIEKRVKYDIEYIENWTFGLDVKILLKTVFGGFMNNEHLK